MTYFLEHLANHFYRSGKENLDRQCLVFPNRRAGFYFTKYLSIAAGKPVWAPEIMTVNELFSSFSGLSIAENETLIFELYSVYKDLNREAESFDEFYYWGDMILNDFDDIDKYLVNPERLYANLVDIKRIDSDFGDLTDDQRRIIKQFWTNFETGSVTSQKKDFLTIWSVMAELYKRFRNSLRTKGIAYEGMVYRELAELSLNGFPVEFRPETFHFIGFNALNNCEIVLMKALKKSGRARFYWDYDIAYVGEETYNSAGFFIRQNLKDFGNDMPDDWSYKTALSDPGSGIRMKVIDTSSDMAQVKYVSEILGGMGKLSDDEAHHTAIVLADENLLIPVLSSIPENIEDINVTMGYPLRYSPVYSLVKHLLALQRNCRSEGSDVFFDHNDVFRIMKHSFFSADKSSPENALVSELVSENNQWVPSGRFNGLKPYDAVFRKVSDVQAISDYIRSSLEIFFIPAKEGEIPGINPVSESNIRNEFIYRSLLALNRLDSIIEGSEIAVSVPTYGRLLDRVLRGMTIPFSGEPLKGIQVMGILETRSLDFRNLIMLSVNEGTLPRSSAGSSYIPYNIREVFGLPTLRHQDSIYSYYFNRLMHRAESVTLIYNSNSEGLRTGEMSRFLLQYKYLKGNIDFSSLRYRINVPRPSSTSVPRSEADIQKLEKIYLEPGSRALSPSAVNMWLYCRMKFYYMYVCGFKEPGEIISEIDPALFGDLLHSVIEKIYLPLLNSILTRDVIEKIMRDKSLIEQTVNDVIMSRFHNNTRISLSGNDQIISSILSEYIQMILRFDSSIKDLKIIGLEKRLESGIRIDYDNRVVQLKVGGIIDRHDMTGDCSRILDYKTGNTSMEISSLGSLFDTADEQRNEAWFQVLMYCALFWSENSNQNLRPSIYAVRKLSDPDYSEMLRIKTGKGTSEMIYNYGDIHNEYYSMLIPVLESVFRKDEPFIMTEHFRKCGFCQYSQLCGR